MAKKKLGLGIFCLAFLLLFSNAEKAQAYSVSMSDAVIDLTSLWFSGPITWLIPGEFGAMAEVWNDDVDDDADDFNDTGGRADALASVDNARGHGWADDNEAGESVWAQADVINTTEAYAYAGAGGFGVFRMEEAGILTVRANYSLSQELAVICDEEGEAYGWATAILAFGEPFDEDPYDIDWADLEHEILGKGSGSWSKSGQLEISSEVQLPAGEEVPLWVHVENEAKVYSENCVIPEPATLSLLGMSLLGLAGLRKKPFKIGRGGAR